MARTETPEIAVATRTFGNSKMHEGVRVKAGTRFAIDKPQGDLKVMKLARFRALQGQGLVRGLNDEDTAAVPKRPVDEQTAAQIAKNKAEKAITTETIRRPSARAAARRKTQEADPPAPRRLNPKSPPAAAQAGSPTGTTADASSSAAVPASNTSATSSKPRGRRRGSAG